MMTSNYLALQCLKYRVFIPSISDFMWPKIHKHYEQSLKSGIYLQLECNH